MGERKVINKYYPADFDPAKIGRRRNDEQMKVRMMVPMSIRCKSCGNFTYKGTKFNSRKEQVMGETCLGIQIFRVYFRCGHCSAELCIKTDPKNADYSVECGATRNYDFDDETSGGRDMMMNAMTRKIVASKRAMEIDAALEDLKSRQAGVVGSDDMLINYNQAAEDEALIKSLRFHSKHDPPPPPLQKKIKKMTSSTSPFNFVRVIKRRPSPPPEADSNNCTPTKQLLHEDQQQHLNISTGLELLFQSYASSCC